MNHPTFSLSFIIICFFLGSCKTGDSQASDTVHTFSILIAENMSPADVPELKKYSIEKMQRTSRSQNLWQVILKSNLKSNDVLKDIESASLVKSVIVGNEDISEPQNSTNKKKGKSTPIKNNE